jgi:aminoglycoside phosphotransferase (APT) family kinase protein
MVSAVKMHADEFDIDVPLVRRLVDAQFPQWADLPLTPVASSGTDNALFRLGDDMAVRLPRTAGATGQVEKDQRWLSFLAPQLPLPISAPLAVGAAGEGFPWSWGVYQWLGGRDATHERLDDPCAVAAELARFIRALHRIDTSAGPEARRESGRGGRLAVRDGEVREAIAALGREIDAGAVTAAWDESLAVPEWGGAPVWVHGDLLPGNLVIAEGRLSAVIDFACLGVGDPACDLISAWSLFDEASREVFRSETGVDDDTWMRGRGWALSIALIALPYYLHTNPVICATSRRVIGEVLEDCASPARAGG